MESNEVFMTCFCAVSSSGTHGSPMITVQKAAFGGDTSLSLRTQALPIFSNISRLPATSYDTRDLKVPAILRDWQELDAEQAAL